MIDYASNRSFVLSTQDETIGGFAKWADYHPGKAVLLNYSSNLLLTFDLDLAN